MGKWQTKCVDRLWGKNVFQKYFELSCDKYWMNAWVMVCESGPYDNRRRSKSINQRQIKLILVWCVYKMFGITFLLNGVFYCGLCSELNRTGQLDVVNVLWNYKSPWKLNVTEWLNMLLYLLKMSLQVWSESFTSNVSTKYISVNRSTLARGLHLLSIADAYRWWELFRTCWCENRKLYSNKRVGDRPLHYLGI